MLLNESQSYPRGLVGGMADVAHGIHATNAADPMVQVLAILADLTDALPLKRALDGFGAGHRLFVFMPTGGDSALEFLRKFDIAGRANGPTLILVDVKLPRLSEEELIAEIGRETHPSICFLTNSPLDVDLAKRWGTDDRRWVTKPIDERQLLRGVRLLGHLRPVLKRRQ